MAIDTGDGLDQRRFARPVRAEQANQFAFPDFEGRAFDDLSLSIANDEGVNVEGHSIAFCRVRMR
jgi:hypothetical protein